MRIPASTPNEWVDNQGISLRDYFAGQALAGMRLMTGGCFKEEVYLEIAQTAYAYADAMLKERDRQ